MAPNFKPNTLFAGDNLDIMRGMNSECIDLIYLDPPFNSNQIYIDPIKNNNRKNDDNHGYFSDIWNLEPIDKDWMEQEAHKIHPCLYEVLEAAKEAYNERMQAYLINMAVRLYEMERLLKPTGSIYLHCDPTASHYLKIVMDCVFGFDNFRNEIVWCYGETARGAKAISKSFAKNNDVILFYTKTNKYLFKKTYFKRVVEIKGSEYKKDKDGKCFRTSPRGDYTDESIKKLEKEGRIYRTKNGNIRIKYFEECDDKFVYEEKITGATWTDIPDMMHSPKDERTGYPTQKPLKLLERIIESSSNEGDLILDPFCGCSTTMVAAQQLGRQWVGIDKSNTAISLVYERMEKLEKPFKHTTIGTEFPKITDNTKQRTDVYSTPGAYKCNNKEKQHLHRQLNGISCPACGINTSYRDFEIDHIKPKSKGGDDTIENKQLLCSTCNKKKGDKTMEEHIENLKKNRSIVPNHKV